jgi:hypothetical protein
MPISDRLSPSLDAALVCVGALSSIELARLLETLIDRSAVNIRDLRNQTMISKNELTIDPFNAPFSPSVLLNIGNQAESPSIVLYLKAKNTKTHQAVDIFFKDHILNTQEFITRANAIEIRKECPVLVVDSLTGKYILGNTDRGLLVEVSKVVFHHQDNAIHLLLETRECMPLIVQEFTDTSHTFETVGIYTQEV